MLWCNNSKLLKCMPRLISGHSWCKLPLSEQIPLDLLIADGTWKGMFSSGSQQSISPLTGFEEEDDIWKITFMVCKLGRFSSSATTSDHTVPQMTNRNLKSLKNLIWIFWRQSRINLLDEEFRLLRYTPNKVSHYSSTVERCEQ